MRRPRPDPASGSGAGAGGAGGGGPGTAGPGARPRRPRGAGARGATGARDLALETAYAALEARRAGTGGPWLPSAEEVVRACLDAIPVALADVALVADPDELNRFGRDALRASRDAKNLVTAASWHADRVRDPDLAARLRDWLAVLPGLV